MEKLLKRASEHGDLKNRSQQVADSSSAQQQQQQLLLSSSDDDEENESKVIANCKLALEQTQALRMANPQLLRPEDYVRLMRLNSFLLKNRSSTPPSPPLPTSPFPFFFDNHQNEGGGLAESEMKDGCINDECMVNIRCKCCCYDTSNNDIKLVNRIKKSTEACLAKNHQRVTSAANRFELNVEAKGTFCSYVAFVTSYVIFLFIVTLLLSRIGKI